MASRSIPKAVKSDGISPSFVRREESREARALLRALAIPAAYGWIGDANGAERLIVAARRNGVSVGSGSFDVEWASAVCSAGLAEWSKGAVSGRERLEITDAGRARCVRMATPGDQKSFLAQHKPLARGAIEVDEPAKGAKSRIEALIDHAESPLAWLATRKGADGQPLIESASLAAGERLRRDFTLAGMEPRMTANWLAAGGRGSSGDPVNYSDIAVAARQRVHRALDFVGGDFVGLLLDVCGFLKGLETVEGERRWPRRSAKLVLTLALRQLARHYGIQEQAVGPRASTGVRHWGTQDFKPLIEPDA